MFFLKNCKNLSWRIAKNQFLKIKYEHFSCIDAACSDLIKVVNEITPSKDIRIKNNTQEWFDREIAELIHVNKKLFLKFRKSKLHTDEENCKKIKYQFQNLIGKQKTEVYDTDLKQKINKPKELWETLKSSDLTSKAVTVSNICFKRQKWNSVFNATKNCSIFKIIFQVLHKTWYLCYLLPLIFLLNLKLHLTITQCQNIWIFNFWRRLLKKY